MRAISSQGQDFNENCFEFFTDITASMADKPLVHGMTDEMEEQDDIRFADLAPALEFACWTVVILAPLLRLVNGPAVTDDQWWIQILLFASAVIGGCSLRLFQVVSRRRSE